MCLNETYNKVRICKNLSDKKRSIFRDITPYSPFKMNRRSAEACHLHFQGRGIRQARNQCKAGGKWSPDTFPIQNGLKQGDALSPFLLSIVSDCVNTKVHITRWDTSAAGLC
jgi:hypothetical protein